MDKTDPSAIFKYFVQKCWKTIEFLKDMLDTLGDSAPSFTTVHKRVTEFKQGRECLEDDPRSGRPKSTTTLEITKKVQDMVMHDRRLNVSEIANDMGIPDFIS